MKDILKVYGPLVLIALLGIFVALRFMDPAPPRQITFAAGAKGGAYYALAERYKARLDEQGIEVIVLETQGSMENLRLLREGVADLALVQGGLATQEERADLRSLGGLFYEPYWVFVRSDVQAESFGELKSIRLAIGPEGSGTRALSLRLQEAWGEGWQASAQDPRSGVTAATALMAGEVDGAAFSASVDASYIRQLLLDPNVRLMPFDRAPALARRTPALAAVTLLRGVVDLQQDIPSQDVPLIASVAQLAVDDALHPAIQSLLLEKAEALHSGNSALASGGEFPNEDLIDLPLSTEARRFYRNGPTALRRWFSFRVANFLDRAWVLFIPLATLLIPLVRAAPPLYRWRVRRKIYVWYSDLRDLEASGRAARTAAEKQSVLDAIADLQKEAGRLNVPLSYTEELYHLRSHISFVRTLVESVKTPEAQA